MVLGFFCTLFRAFYPSNYPLQVCNTLYVCLHAGRAGLLHFLGDVTIYVQSKGGGMVSHIGLNGLYIIPGPEGCHCIAVPLWHNKDKSENPCVATGWRFVLILFPLKTALKRGLREGVKNQGCT